MPTESQSTSMKFHFSKTKMSFQISRIYLDPGGFWRQNGQICHQRPKIITNVYVSDIQAILKTILRE